jgi:hypothetical protein
MRNLIAVAFVLSTAFLTSADAAPAPLPDLLAWQDFIAMTAPAPGAHAVAFETWASDSDIFTATPHWPGAPHMALVRSLAAAASDHAASGPVFTATDGCYPRGGKAGNFPDGACIGEEVQHNRPIYDAIVGANLFTKAGLAQDFIAGKPIRFPDSSIVVKADWILVTDIMRWLPGAYKSAADVRHAYYTNAGTFNGKPGEYALAGMSVQSRHFADWLWSTFEHRGNPGRCDVIGCHDGFGAVAANVAPHAVSNTDYGPCAKSPALAALFGGSRIDPIWNNYCLKGTQTRFVTSSGQATILANSVIERMNKGVPVEETSCITCHAYASFDRNGAANGAVLQLRPRPTGAVHNKLLSGFKTYDYMWGLLAAP